MAVIATVNAVAAVPNALILAPANAEVDDATITIMGGTTTYEELAALAVAMLWEHQKAYNLANPNAPINTCLFSVNQAGDGKIKGSFEIPIADLDPGAGFLSVTPGVTFADPV